MSAKKEAIDQTAHVAIGVVLALPVALYAPFWACGLSGLWCAILREHEQHKNQGWLWPFRGGGRWLDIMFVTIGASLMGLWGDF